MGELDEDELLNLKALDDDSSLAAGGSDVVSDEREPAVAEEEEGEGVSLVAAVGCQSSSLHGKVTSLWSRLRETWFFKELVMMIRLALPFVSSFHAGILRPWNAWSLCLQFFVNGFQQTPFLFILLFVGRFNTVRELTAVGQSL